METSTSSAQQKVGPALGGEASVKRRPGCVTVSRTGRNQRRTRSTRRSPAGSPGPTPPLCLPRGTGGTALRKVLAQEGAAQYRWPRGGHSTHSPESCGTLARAGTVPGTGHTGRTAVQLGKQPRRPGTQATVWAHTTPTAPHSGARLGKREQEGRSSVPRTVGPHSEVPNRPPSPGESPNPFQLEVDTCLLQKQISQHPAERCTGDGLQSCTPAAYLI